MKLKGPKTFPVIGSAREFRKGPLTFFQNLDEKFDGIAKVKLGPVEGVFTSRPEMIKEVLATKNKSFVKGSSYKELKHFLKDGLLTSEGETWFKQRRLAQPSFYKKTVEGFFDIMLKYSNNTVDKWNRKGGFQALPEMNNLTLAAIGESVFDRDLTKDSKKIGDNLAFMIKETNTRMWNIVNWPIWFPTKNNRKFNKGIKSINDVVFRLIKERRLSNETEKSDFIQMLLEAEDADSGERMNDQEIRDELMTIFVAGHETTALTLSWAMYLIAKHPKVQNRIQNEIKTLGTEGLTSSNVWGLKYIRAVLNEVMRLYPPAWIVGRVAVEDVEISGILVKKGQDVLISPFVVQRSDRLWNNPNQFDPDRFLGDNKKSIGKYTFFPFGGGPRICIGEQFAIMEMIIAIAVIYGAGTPILKDENVVMVPLVTLRPDKEIDFDWKPN